MVPETDHNEIYPKLAKHLDQLPGGYPPTPDGLELRILRRLFTPAEAELALHLTLIPERAAVIAKRAGIPLAQVEPMLAEMAAKGLLVDMVARKKEDGSARPARYMAAQFVIGIWEYQVKRLDQELAEMMGEYLKIAFNPQTWQKAPQIRTIPIGASLETPSEVLTYESAEQMLEPYDRFAVAPCICREEKNLLDEGCGKTLETCLSMGGAADFYVRHNRGRYISKEEVLQILETANREGLVLQPGNTQDASFICCCCGDCCGVLRNAKLHPHPAEILSSAFYAVVDDQLCAGCGDCLERCQMEAIQIDIGTAVIDLERCIGCGLCVTTCPSDAMRLERKPEDQRPYIPKNTVELYLRLAHVRGLLGPAELAKIALQSGIDRLRSGG